jgi:adenosylhomocysteinase
MPTAIDAYFNHLVSTLSPGRLELDVVCVAHMVPNSLSFLPAMNRLAHVSLLLPKPKSVERPEFGILSKDFPVQPLDREWVKNADQVCAKIVETSPDRPLVIVDIGGYFATIANQLKFLLGERLVGIMEGTENGYKKYQEVGVMSLPVATVARSPLKLPEDYLVGASVVFSIEAILRDSAQILQTRSACLIGYGRVGSAIADVLRGRGINTVVFDESPLKLAEASARGFVVSRNRTRALSGASLVVCATGDKALDRIGFAALRPEAVVAAVTSGDDEFDLEALRELYGQGEEVSPALFRYVERGGSGRDFFLVNDGNAANFVHGAVIGPAIQLIEGEKLAAVAALANGTFEGRTGLLEMEDGARTIVAKVWNDHFLPD